jgi:hypothetical protein
MRCHDSAIRPSTMASGNGPQDAAQCCSASSTRKSPLDRSISASITRPAMPTCTRTVAIVRVPPELSTATSHGSWALPLSACSNPLLARRSRRLSTVSVGGPRLGGGGCTLAGMRTGTTCARRRPRSGSGCLGGDSLTSRVIEIERSLSGVLLAYAMVGDREAIAPSRSAFTKSAATPAAQRRDCFCDRLERTRSPGALAAKSTDRTPEHVGDSRHPWRNSTASSLPTRARTAVNVTPTRLCTPSRWPSLQDSTFRHGPAHR